MSCGDPETHWRVDEPGAIAAGWWTTGALFMLDSDLSPSAGIAASTLRSEPADVWGWRTNLRAQFCRQQRRLCTEFRFPLPNLAGVRNGFGSAKLNRRSEGVAKIAEDALATIMVVCP